jgi:hypothetical protein
MDRSDRFVNGDPSRDGVQIESARFAEEVVLVRFAARLLLLTASLLAGLPAGAAELAVLARPGPWPVADRLIAYQGKIWFSTAVKGTNHNSADVWSFDPAGGELRFERYLFSQDAGIPAVHGGLLYWPHEDMRQSLGTGVVSVTNGRDWRNLQLPPDNTMMHTHAVAEWGGRLVAVLAGWDSALVASADAGRSWEVLANDPPRSGRFHRYNGVTALGGRLFVRHWERTGLSLAEFRDGRMVDVEGWPESRGISEFTRFRGALYAIVAGRQSSQLWRIGAGAPERVRLPELDMRALASDGGTLWLVTRSGNGGRLWSSRDGMEFAPGDGFDGGVPHSAVAMGGGIYVGGAGSGGRAILWGSGKGSEAPAGEIRPLPDQHPVAGEPFDVQSQGERLRAALADIVNYQRHGRALRALIRDMLAQDPPQGFFGAMLDADVPDEEVELFGGQFSVPARDIATWQLTAAMGLNRETGVPLAFLERPWRHPPNGPQKWFDPLLIGLHAVKVAGQNDRATVDTLIRRLDRPDDPDWLRSQVTGTLVALTGERFAYDTDGWRTWWRAAKGTWPSTPGSG